MLVFNRSRCVESGSMRFTAGLTRTVFNGGIELGNFVFD